MKVVPLRVFCPKLHSFVFGVLNFVFLATSLSGTSFSVFKSRETVFNLPTSKLSSFVFKLSKLVGKVFKVLS